MTASGINFICAGRDELDGCIVHICGKTSVSLEKYGFDININNEAGPTNSIDPAFRI